MLKCVVCGNSLPEDFRISTDPGQRNSLLVGMFRSEQFTSEQITRCKEAGSASNPGICPRHVRIAAWAFLRDRSTTDYSRSWDEFKSTFAHLPHPGSAVFQCLTACCQNGLSTIIVQISNFLKVETPCFLSTYFFILETFRGCLKESPLATYQRTLEQLVIPGPPSQMNKRPFDPSLPINNVSTENEAPVVKRARAACPPNGTVIWQPWQQLGPFGTYLPPIRFISHPMSVLTPGSSRMSSESLMTSSESLMKSSGSDRSSESMISTSGDGVASSESAMTSSGSGMTSGSSSSIVKSSESTNTVSPTVPATKNHSSLLCEFSETKCGVTRSRRLSVQKLTAADVDAFAHFLRSRDLDVEDCTKSEGVRRRVVATPLEDISTNDSRQNMDKSVVEKGKEAEQKLDEVQSSESNENTEENEMETEETDCVEDDESTVPAHMRKRKHVPPKRVRSCRVRVHKSRVRRPITRVVSRVPVEKEDDSTTVSATPASPSTVPLGNVPNSLASTVQCTQVSAPASVPTSTASLASIHSVDSPTSPTQTHTSKVSTAPVSTPAAVVLPETAAASTPQPATPVSNNRGRVRREARAAAGTVATTGSFLPGKRPEDWETYHPMPTYTPPSLLRSSHTREPALPKTKEEAEQKRIDDIIKSMVGKYGQSGCLAQLDGVLNYPRHFDVRRLGQLSTEEKLSIAPYEFAGVIFDVLPIAIDFPRYYYTSGEAIRVLSRKLVVECIPEQHRHMFSFNGCHSLRDSARLLRIPNYVHYCLWRILYTCFGVSWEKREHHFLRVAISNSAEHLVDRMFNVYRKEYNDSKKQLFQPICHGVASLSPAQVSSAAHRRKLGLPYDDRLQEYFDKVA